MSLQSILDLDGFGGSFSKDDVSEKRLKECLPQLCEQIAFYRAYPDIFIDDLSGYSQWNEETDGPWKGFKFFYYQRINNVVPLVY